MLLLPIAMTRESILLPNHLGLLWPAVRMIALDHPLLVKIWRGGVLLRFSNILRRERSLNCILPHDVVKYIAAHRL
jgi:hypothetical protein